MPQYPDGFLTWAPVQILYAVYAEREANRDRIAELEALLDATEPPEPPPTQPHDDRVQVIWPIGLAQGAVESVVNGHNLSRVYAAVLTADVQHKVWGPPVIAKLKAAGVKVLAYVRAPVHARVGALRDASVSIGAGSPFEAAVYNLVKARDAWVRDPAGNILWHPGGYDAYLTPWLIADEHARLVREHVWDAAYYDGLLVDGLVTNQIYAGGGADYDRDGAVDVVKAGWLTVSRKQETALRAWVGNLGDVPVIGNGSWEPYNPDHPQSEWPIAGAFDEDLTHPVYPDGNETKQGPALSQRWAMHRACAEAWLQAGKAYWLGSRARLHNLERERELQFCIATALLLGAKIVENTAHPWLVKPLGRPLEPGLLAADGQWFRHFEHGVVEVDPDRKEGSVRF